MLGEQIKELRLARNMNQVELAHKLHVSKQSVSNWENNNILPSIELLKRIANFFSCSTDYLLEIEQGAQTIDVTSLTLEQRAHIDYLISNYAKLNEYEKIFSFSSLEALNSLHGK